MDKCILYVCVKFRHWKADSFLHTCQLEMPLHVTDMLNAHLNSLTAHAPVGQEVSCTANCGVWYTVCSVAGHADMQLQLLLAFGHIKQFHMLYSGDTVTARTVKLTYLPMAADTDTS